MLKRILGATGNRNKLLELQTVAKDFEIEMVSPDQIREEKGLSSKPVVEENGKTYRENAELKARAYAEWAGYPALGDDSGLEVTALDNRPGLLSARYGGPDLTDSERIEKLLSEFNEIGGNDRTAYFVCSLCLVYPDGEVLYADSKLKGVVLNKPQGTAGFGYDPIILIDDLGKTLAEVDFSVTCSKGFRAAAARELFSKLSDN